MGLRILTFTRRSSSDVRIGAVLRNGLVLDLKEALVSLLTDRYGISMYTALDLANSIAGDTRKFIELHPLIGSLVTEAISIYGSREPEHLVRRGLALRVDEIRFLPVVPNPSKVIGIGLNYEEYRVMLKYPKPEVPLFFFKPTNTLLGHEDYVAIPRGGKWPGTASKCVFHEFEMAVVMGRRTKNVAREDVYKHIFGVTIFGDITAHDIEMVQPGFVLYQQRSKAFDTFSPVGPWIVTMDEIELKGIDLHNLRIARRRNGVVEAESNTRNMMFKIPEIIEFLSEIMTLEPGDIVSLGSPPTGPPEGLQPGDVIEVEIEHIGVLRNYVK